MDNAKFIWKSSQSSHHIRLLETYEIRSDCVTLVGRGNVETSSPIDGINTTGARGCVYRPVHTGHRVMGLWLESTKIFLIIFGFDQMSGLLCCDLRRSVDNAKICTTVTESEFVLNDHLTGKVQQFSS